MRALRLSTTAKRVIIISRESGVEFLIVQEFLEITNPLFQHSHEWELWLNVHLDVSNGHDFLFDELSENLIF
jgi:hypothetical protein